MCTWHYKLTALPVLPQAVSRILSEADTMVAWLNLLLAVCSCPFPLAFHAAEEPAAVMEATTAQLRYLQPAGAFLILIPGVMGEPTPLSVVYQQALILLLSPTTVELLQLVHTRLLSLRP